MSYVYYFLKEYIHEYLLGFNKDQFNLEIFKGKINISKAKLRPDKVNEILEEQNLPFVLKAGLFTNIHCRFKTLTLVHELFTKRLSSLFSSNNRKIKSDKDPETPISIEIEEILLVIGPSLKYMNNHEYNKPEDTIDDLEESMEVVN